MMSVVTRRAFLQSSGLGLGVLAGAGLTGCATAIKGDFAPKKGPRVVVIGGEIGRASCRERVYDDV